MKVTLNWLNQYVDFNWSAEELSERLTMIGIEVERVEKVSGEFEGVVVAQVITCDKHPNADKLTIWRSPFPSLTRQSVSLSALGCLSHVMTWATTTPSNSPETFWTPSTSMPSMVRRSANS